MKTLEQISQNVKEILTTDWKRRHGYVVPESTDVELQNEAVEFEAAVLYADMRKSTELVQGYRDYFVAKLYKAFLATVCDVIKNNEGTITSFDGDRVMGVFLGDSKCSNSAKAGLQIYAAVRKVNKEIKVAYPNSRYEIDFAAGIDVSDLFVVRTGVRGSNDLAWIGTAANNAAKLSEKSHPGCKTFITGRVFDRINKQSKYGGANNSCMWSNLQQTIMGQQIYGSGWWWNF